MIDEVEEIAAPFKPLTAEEDPKLAEKPERAVEKELVHDWKRAGGLFPNSIFRKWSDGTIDSTTDQNPEIIEWVSVGNKILPATKQ